MKRDMTVQSREAAPQMGGNYILVKASNYAGDSVEMMISVKDEEQFQVYDIITVEVTSRQETLMTPGER